MRTHSILLSLSLLAGCTSVPPPVAEAPPAQSSAGLGMGPRLQGGKRMPVPDAVRRFLLSLPTRDILVPPATMQRYLQEDVLVQQVSEDAGSRNFVVLDRNGSDYGIWIRSFQGNRPELTGYLVEAQGLCAELEPTAPVAAAERQCRYDKYFESGIRAYRVIEGRPPEDVTASIAPDPEVVRLYREQYEAMGANPIMADEDNLDQVPVLRWVVGFDPENTSASPDPPIFDGGHSAHAGFVVWNGENFERRTTVPRALWPCRAEGRPIACPSRMVDGDPFVTD